MSDDRETLSYRHPAGHARHGSPSKRSERRRLSIEVIAFAVVAIVVMMTGGSARPDNGWLLVLRPICIIVIVVLLLASDLDWRGLRPLAWLLALFAGSIAIQLVPLPPFLWCELPGRASYDAVARTLGGNSEWHPLAVAPDLAWNSLAALLVPFVVLVGVAALQERERQGLLPALLALVGTSMLLGMFQVVGGAESALYWYWVDGRGQLVGLFANRNHQGALLALALPLLRAWAQPSGSDWKAANMRGIAALGAGGVIVLYIIVLGSRAGLLLLPVGLGAAFLVEPSFGWRGLMPRYRKMLMAGLIVGAVSLLAGAVFAGRAESFNRFTGNELTTEGRLLALPTLLHIVERTMPWGTGFGSFVPVYASYEPDALLDTSYFNNAHDDLIELAITGGLPALAVFAAFLIWWMRTGWGSLRARSTVARPYRRACACGILILLLASLTDYPLRTPLMAMVFCVLCCGLAVDPSPSHRAVA